MCFFSGDNYDYNNNGGDLMGKKIILIDGHSILHRAFYGVPELTNSMGFHTNAIYGFLNILFKVLEEEKADHLAVAFDVKAPTFRHEIFSEYKGTRKPMPEELREQIPVLKEILKAMQIPVITKDGLEADDILGTIAKQSETLGIEVSLVSGDRDLLQIASHKIKIRIPKTKGGKTEVEDYYWDDVIEKYGVDPIQFIDLKALMGDASDNIPGVPKIGEKTATELIKEYGSVEGVYDNLDKITKKSIKETLGNNRQLADLSKVLATINIHGEFDFEFEDAKIGDLYTKEAYEWFKKLEFKNLFHRFSIKEEKNNYSIKFQSTESLEEAERIFLNAKKQEIIGYFVLEDGKMDHEFAGIAICFSPEDNYFIKAGGFFTKGYLAGKLADLAKHCVESKGRHILSGYYLKGDYDLLQVEDTTNLFDIQLAAYLVNPLKNDYHTDDIANEYLNMQIPTQNQLIEKLSFIEALDKKADEVQTYVCNQALVAFLSYVPLKKALDQIQMTSLFETMEMPLSLVLFHMEQEGIKVKREELQIYSESLNGRIIELEEEIYKQAGMTFNINSPKQLGEILFENMNLPGGKKTKTGYSTAADVLEKLAFEFPIVNSILEYRGLTKLKSTYAEGLQNYIGKEERIHTTFNQTIAATGRISSTEPNLQNIPMKIELGRLIRKVFVPKDGYVFLDADYSQIELRILAHMSGDENLIEAYKTDTDIHRITASKVFHTPMEEVTSLQRRNAKAVNFGIVYGISSFGLSQDLSITPKVAATYIKAYFETYPKVKEFLDKLIEDAKTDGYVTTLFGRRRPIPELSSSNFVQRNFGERVAMNSPIQGTAADIMKIAMINVYQKLKKAKLKSKLILQIHDELLIETAIDEIGEVKDILEEAMKTAADLKVRLEVDTHMGENWYDAK